MEKSCSFFGHRKIERTEQLVARLDDLLEMLIVEKGVTIFLFGSRSEFDSLCHERVTLLQTSYPQIKRMVKNNIIFGVHNASYVEYDLLDGNKRFYLQNICWWNDEPANISICIGGTATHKVLIEDYEIKSLLVNRDNKVAIYQKDNNTELLLVNDTGIIKGYGIADLLVYTESGCTNLKVSVEGEKIFNIADLL